MGLLSHRADVPVDQAMIATLTVTTGPDAGRSCRLEPEAVLLVGRGPECTFRLSDPGVSRLHCRLIADVDGVRIEDADSRYGTLVNRHMVSIQVLQPGDVIAVGDTEMRFECEEPTAETVPPQALSAAAPEWFPDESVTYDAADHPLACPSRSDVDELLGSTFVRFQIETLLARTASGVVYRAIDPLHQRPVALKVYWPALFTDDRAMSRFLRSMRAMVPLQHAHLVNLYAAGRSGGLCFTACEFIEGETAGEMIDRIGIAGMLDWRTTWRIAVGLTEALAYLHERQILHRSLHPNNIFVRQEDRCVKLGDSLLAKSLDQLGQLALTARGDVVGDIYYLPPEQLSPRGTVDHRADIYSLGATLYALLSGRPPFLGGPAEVVRQILTAAPQPPKQLHLAIPVAFEGIVLRMLEKTPEARFPHAAGVLQELQRIGKYEGLC